MATIQSIVDTVKTKATLISTSISLVASIGGAIVYVENNYAHAEDVKEILTSQKAMIKNQERSQRSQIMFQLEYYDDRIKKLTAELSLPKGPGIRSKVEVQSELDDIKKRRELARAALTE